MKFRKILIVFAAIAVASIAFTGVAFADNCPYTCTFVCVNPGNCATLNDFIFADEMTKSTLEAAGWSIEELQKYWNLSDPGCLACPNPNHWISQYVTVVPLTYVNGSMFCKDPVWSEKFMAMPPTCDLDYLKPEDRMEKTLANGKTQVFARIGAVPFISAGFMYNLYILNPDKNPDSGFLILNCGNFSPNPRKASISGHKWRDDNANGIWNKGTEPPIESWTIILKDCSGNTLKTTQTKTNGYYEFTDLEPGCYRVCEENRTGYKKTFPTFDCYNVTLAKNQHLTDLDFGNCQTSCITGMKWSDKDKDGIRDPGEPAVENCLIVLTYPDGSQKSTLTDINGNYRFDGLLPGHYKVCEQCSYPGCIITKPAGGSNCYEIDLKAPDCSTGNDFGNYCPPSECSLSGRKFGDNNMNCKLDDGSFGDCPTNQEFGLPGWTIKITGPVTRTTTTGADGSYKFEGLPCGTYVVEEINPDPTIWKQTCPKTGKYEVTLTGTNHIATGLDFGNVKYASMCGLKVADCNANGIFDNNEGVLCDWSVCYRGYAADGTYVDKCVKTKANGTFCFEQVLPGKYEFYEVAVSGWIMTCKPADICVKAGQQIKDLMFCNHFTGRFFEIDRGSYISVTYMPGWNMVAAPAGSELGLGDMWWYDGVENIYKSSNSFLAGRGYWIYLQNQKTVMIPVAAPQNMSIYLVKGWNLVGNSLTSPVDFPASMFPAWWYNPISGEYESVRGLGVGQAAWVYTTTPQMVLLTGK